MNKAEAVLEAIRKCEVGENVVIHNSDGSIAYIIKVITKEHPEDKDDGLHTIMRLFFDFAGNRSKHKCGE